MSENNEIATLGEHPNPTPEVINLDETETEALDSMFIDISGFIKKGQEIQMMAQQLQQSLAQNNSDLNGTAKAVEVFIKTLVRQHDAIGNYVYDTEKKVLVVKKEIKVTPR
jgi:hypothetical protein